ncbi:class I SAM-dependent methyltransferase [Bacillus tianshenii]|nr:class I SAM-dependent methyltransferase [Bacillus tianshenii]
MDRNNYFSSQSQEYALYRPTYPDELFNYITSFVEKKEVVLDCATGSGQAAVPLSERFKQVIAVDISERQLQYAEKRANIRYAVSPVEQLRVPENSVDLVTVAQGAHWFQFDAFYKEVQRVAKKDAAIVVWGYGLCTISREIDQILHVYYYEIVGKFWPAERKYIDEEYKTLPFPFAEIQTLDFEIKIKWTAQQFLAYLFTWSATQMYMKEEGKNPLQFIKDEIERLWGDEAREIRWPIFIRAGYVNQ